MKLFSFDIDGTMEIGSPPGVVPVEMVRKAKQLGYFVGSASDRPISDQKGIWADRGIQVDFVVLKHNIGEIKARFQADEYFHIGDTDVDRYFAEKAGFHFLLPQPFDEASWPFTASKNGSNNNGQSS